MKFYRFEEDLKPGDAFYYAENNTFYFIVNEKPNKDDEYDLLLFDAQLDYVLITQGLPMFFCDRVPDHLCPSKELTKTICTLYNTLKFLNYNCHYDKYSPYFKNADNKAMQNDLKKIIEYKNMRIKHTWRLSCRK